jgi:ABC-type branched-subunit amino acid transport system ATPase component
MEGAAVSAPVLDVADVTKVFGGLTAISHASLSMPVGTIHGLIGPNGAGKSTMIGVISGFIKDFTGQVRFDGHDLSSLDPTAIAKLGISRTFQQATPIAGLTALENVMVGMHVHHRAGVGSVLLRSPSMRREAREIRDTARAVLDEFGLSGDAESDAADLPFGKLRFLELARAVVMRPKILLLDEPAAGLNATETERLAGVVRRQVGLGVGILLVDHDVPFVFGLCDQVTVMNFGSVIASGPPSQVYRDPAVREAYLGAEAAAEASA